MAEVKIGFWNLRRLGASSSEEKRKYIAATIERLHIDLLFMCELLAGSSYPEAWNLTYRDKNPHQLCYACVDANGKPVPMDRYDPVSTHAYRALGLSGVNTFSSLVNRAPAKVVFRTERGNAINVIALHAPASEVPATVALAFLVADLIARGGRRWVLIGDLNVEPDTFSEATKEVFEEVMAAGGAPTFKGFVEDKEFDYAFTNVADANTAVSRASMRLSRGDHEPIVFTCDIF